MTPEAVWRVGCRLGFRVSEPATVALQIAPAATAGDVLDATLDVTIGGDPLDVELFDGDHGAVVQILHSPVGELSVAYDGVIQRGEAVPGPPVTSLDAEQLTYLRQSRYCPSDELSGFAAYELGHLGPGPELLAAVGGWVASRLTYLGGASGPLDTAVDSLFAGRGVCRDFAHLAITMLRALDVPARLVAVYAPGLSPMDFHAVVEAYVDGRWCILDPTRLAPRASLVRITTGRDAADTAFVTVIGGTVELLRAEVTAVIDGDLPMDDHTGVVVLPL
ncbi:MAG TPA: transglutaminase family protein [Acidimicrobiales bacterium]|nr:transglutaminase family protein [Acidimicrobiales bacterium]